MQKTNGFTLIELLLTMAVLAVLSTVSLFVFQGAMNGNGLMVDAEVVAEGARLAETRSRAVDQNANWGIHVSSTMLTVFKGGTFSTRDLNYDEETTLNSLSSVTGVTDIVFSKMYGYPDRTGTTTLTSVDNQSANIVVNTRGTISY